MGSIRRWGRVLEGEMAVTWFQRYPRLRWAHPHLLFYSTAIRALRTQFDIEHCSLSVWQGPSPYAAIFTARVNSGVLQWWGRLHFSWKTWDGVPACGVSADRTTKWDTSGPGHSGLTSMCNLNWKKEKNLWNPWSVRKETDFSLIIVSPMTVEMHFPTLMNGHTTVLCDPCSKSPKVWSLRNYLLINLLIAGLHQLIVYISKKCFIMHPVGEHSLMMNQHVQAMLTELCPLLVLHDCKAIAGGDYTQAAYAGKSHGEYISGCRHGWVSCRNVEHTPA